LSLLAVLLASAAGSSVTACGGAGTSSDQPRPAWRGEGELEPLQYQLDNGLTVILQEDHTAPVVAIQVWVNVGSADETDREAGLAHVHEHMLFKGTERRGVGEIAASIENAGGMINAWTSFDQTVYHVVVASRFAEEGLDVPADAGGTVRVHWKSGGNRPVARWVLQSRSGSRWLTRVLPANTGILNLAGDRQSDWPQTVAVTAIDRYGNASPTAIATPVRISGP
jgi:hypothetical protein